MGGKVGTSDVDGPFVVLPVHSTVTIFVEVVCETCFVLVVVPPGGGGTFLDMPGQDFAQQPYKMAISCQKRVKISFSGQGVNTRSYYIDDPDRFEGL